MNQLLITWPLPSQMQHYRCITYWLTVVRCYFMSKYNACQYTVWYPCDIHLLGGSKLLSIFLSFLVQNTPSNVRILGRHCGLECHFPINDTFLYCEDICNNCKKKEIKVFQLGNCLGKDPNVWNQYFYGHTTPHHAAYFSMKFLHRLWQQKPKYTEVLANFWILISKKAWEASVPVWGLLVSVSHPFSLPVVFCLMCVFGAFGLRLRMYYYLFFFLYQKLVLPDSWACFAHIDECSFHWCNKPLCLLRSESSHCITLVG